MICLPKNIPSNLLPASGNRGVNFFKAGCNFPDEELCSLVTEENSEIFLLKEESENDKQLDLLLVYCNT